LRAVAALWVVLFHMRETIELVVPGVSPSLRSGYLGVDLFFVLSGFIISYNYGDRLGAWSLRSYGSFLWARLARFYPVHVFCLVAMLALGASGLADHIKIGDPARYSADAFFESVLLVHSWALPLAKSWNVPSWSISSEWFAYLMFPAFLAFASGAARLRLAWLYVAVLLVLAAAVYAATDFPGTAAYGLMRVIVCFAIGCVLHQGYQARLWSDARWGLIVPAAVLLALGSYMLLMPLGLPVLVWIPLPLAVVVYGLAWERGVIGRSLRWPLMHYGGRLSYSLYMTHYVCILTVRSHFPTKLMAEAGLAERIGALAIESAAILVAAIFTYHFVEEPCRRWMRRMKAPTILRLVTARGGTNS
jgi:peptidoglycan/LPS O-acetylase OafA/YrhL